MKLVIIIGSGAVGKMTVGQALMAKTGLRLFHNHMIIEPVLEVFGYYNHQAVSAMRRIVFEEFVKSNEKGLIFTYMWAFDSPSDWEYITNVADLFKQHSGDVYWVELVADQAVRLERNKTENRLANKKSKRDLEVSERRLLNEETKYRLVSYEGEIPFTNYIKIDNTALTPDEVVDVILNQFNL